MQDYACMNRMLDDAWYAGFAVPKCRHNTGVLHIRFSPTSLAEHLRTRHKRTWEVPGIELLNYTNLLLLVTYANGAGAAWLGFLVGWARPSWCWPVAQIFLPPFIYIVVRVFCLVDTTKTWFCAKHTQFVVLGSWTLQKASICLEFFSSLRHHESEILCQTH